MQHSLTTQFTSLPIITLPLALFFSLSHPPCFHFLPFSPFFLSHLSIMPISLHFPLHKALISSSLHIHILMSSWHTAFLIYYLSNEELLYLLDPAGWAFQSFFTSTIHHSLWHSILYHHLFLHSIFTQLEPACSTPRTFILMTPPVLRNHKHCTHSMHGLALFVNSVCKFLHNIYLKGRRWPVCHF